MRVRSSRAELDLLLMQVRARLDRQRRDPILVDGGYEASGTYVGSYAPGTECRRANGSLVPALLIEESWNSFLSEMAIHGRALRDRLFSDAASQEVLKAIREATSQGDVIQVWTRDEAKEFLLPWAWIYDGEYRPASRDKPQPDEFWGQRLIIEQLVEIPDPELRTTLTSRISTEDGIKIHAGVYNFAQLPAHRKFLEALAGAAAPDGQARAVAVEIDERADRFVAFLERCDADLIYFFCHGHTARPPGVAPATYYDMFENLQQWLTSSDDREEGTEAPSSELKEAKIRLRGALAELLASGLMAHDHVRLKDGCLMLADLRKLTLSRPHAPLVVLNMCESAQVFPSLSDGLVNVFLSGGCRGVIGTEMPMLPQFADLFGRKLLTAILEGMSVGRAMLTLKREFMAARNPLGLAYTHFGDAVVRFEPAVLSADDKREAKNGRSESAGVE
jgi:hypothetical protein